MIARPKQDAPAREGSPGEPKCSSWPLRRGRVRRGRGGRGSNGLTFAGLALAVALAGVAAASLIVTERRRHEAAEQELTSEARFLESLVETMGSIAGSDDVLERTREEAERLFEARALLLEPGERPEQAPAENAIVIPLRARDDEIGALRLTRERPFDRDDVVRATVLADFAAREHENAQLLDEARVREAERSRLVRPDHRRPSKTSGGALQTSCTTAQCSPSRVSRCFSTRA